MASATALTAPILRCWPVTAAQSQRIFLYSPDFGFGNCNDVAEFSHKLSKSANG